MPIVKWFYDQQTGTLTYVVSDPVTKNCAIIDSLLSYDLETNLFSSEPVQAVIDYIDNQGLTLQWILETHIHADHVTGATYLKEKKGGKTAIGRGILKVLDYWCPLLAPELSTEFGKSMAIDGSQFDCLLDDEDVFYIGQLPVKVKATPGHTPACVCFHVGDYAFGGDTLFQPTLGTARADFPGGSAEMLYLSVSKLLQFPHDTIICAGHDYPALNEAPSPFTSVRDHLVNNKAVKQSKEEFIKWREKRDKGKPNPRLFNIALPLNLCGGICP